MRVNAAVVWGYNVMFSDCIFRSMPVGLKFIGLGCLGWK